MNVTSENLKSLLINLIQEFVESFHPANGVYTNNHITLRVYDESMSLSVGPWTRFHYFWDEPEMILVQQDMLSGYLRPAELYDIVRDSLDKIKSKI